MPGSSTRTAAWPRPLELVARLLIASTLVFLVCNRFGRVAVEPMLPVLRTAVASLDDQFAILAVDIAAEGSSQTVRVRANLTRPIEGGGKTLYPFGSGPMPPGGYQVTITVGSILEYCALVIIAVISWPAARVREYALRVVIALPLLAVLLFVHVPITVLAELWNLVHQILNLQSPQPLMVWSRFLTGGGGLALAIILASLTITLSSCASSRHRQLCAARAEDGENPRS